MDGIDYALWGKWMNINDSKGRTMKDYAREQFETEPNTTSENVGKVPESQQEKCPTCGYAVKGKPIAINCSDKWHQVRNNGHFCPDRNRRIPIDKERCSLCEPSQPAGAREYAANYIEAHGGFPHSIAELAAMVHEYARPKEAEIERLRIDHIDANTRNMRANERAENAERERDNLREGIRNLRFKKTVTEMRRAADAILKAGKG